MAGVSDTAYAIATMRALEAERPERERLFEDPFARIFAEAGAHAEAGTKLFLSLPFFHDGVRLRTRFVDNAVREALADGLRQVVLLGAGFDMRAQRMPEIAGSGARVFEVDVPEALSTKRALLEAAGVESPDHVARVAADFLDRDLPAKLRTDLEAHGHRVGEGTLFVLEGVVAYLDAPAVERTFQLAGALGTRLVFDFAPTAFEPDPAEARTRRAGFSRFEQVGFDVLWRRYMPQAGPPHENAAIPHMGTAAQES